MRKFISTLLFAGFAAMLFTFVLAQEKNQLKLLSRRIIHLRSYYGDGTMLEER
jgi:hypothetical protein